MKQIARWAVLSIAAVAASAAIPAFADGDEPEATGTATVENDILTLSGLVTNVTAEADLGASVTQVVMTAEGRSISPRVSEPWRHQRVGS